MSESTKQHRLQTVLSDGLWKRLEAVADATGIGPNELARRIIEERLMPSFNDRLEEALNAPERS